MLGGGIVYWFYFIVLLSTFTASPTQRGFSANWGQYCHGMYWIYSACQVLFQYCGCFASLIISLNDNKRCFFFVCLFWKALNSCCCKIRTHHNTTLKAFSQQDCGSQQRRKRSVDQAGGRGKRSAVVSAGPVVVNTREAPSSCESCKWLIVYTELACSRCRSL